jgi:23S rRNA (uridine2552-2'-O)-methyltransferase
VDRKKNRFNKAWMHEHVTDHWVQEARARGYRARAAFKLIEVDDRDHLLKPGIVVVDLGAAPGSWSQVVVERLKGRGRIVALDLLPVPPIPGVEVIRGDFNDMAVAAALERALGGAPVDLVLSDMAPNLSGVASVDQAKSVQVAELALEFAGKWLQPDGALLVKVFQGEGFDAFRRQMAASFATVAVRKPKASRERSSEVYLLGRGRRRVRQGEESRPQ